MAETVDINLEGKILQCPVISSTENDEKAIDISKLNRGIYFIRGNREGAKLAEKFIKL